MSLAAHGSGSGIPSAPFPNGSGAPYSGHFSGSGISTAPYRSGSGISSPPNLIGSGFASIPYPSGSGVSSAPFQRGSGVSSGGHPHGTGGSPLPTYPTGAFGTGNPPFYSSGAGTPSNPSGSALSTNVHGPVHPPVANGSHASYGVSQSGASAHGSRTDNVGSIYVMYPFGLPSGTRQYYGPPSTIATLSASALASNAASGGPLSNPSQNPGSQNNFFIEASAPRTRRTVTGKSTSYVCPTPTTCDTAAPTNFEKRDAGFSGPDYTLCDTCDQTTIFTTTTSFTATQTV